MNKSDRVCPLPEELLALLAENVTAEEEARLTQHLENCPRCRHTLEELAASQDVRSGVVQLKTTPRPSTKLASVLNLSVRDVPQSQVAANVEDVLALLESSPAAAATDDTIIGRVHHYKLLQFLGRGGMGVVFKANDLELQRDVAIKFLSPALINDEQAVERFLREARAIAAVNHPGIVTIHAVSQSAPLPYLVMELVHGVSLQDHLDRRHKLSPKTTRRIGFQIAGALHAAHRAGIIHRDIKPANILIEDETGRARLTDFGLARAETDSGLTQSGMLVGSPAYLSPEVIEEKPIDHRADLFSLGSVLYVMCTGRDPANRSSMIGILQSIAACDFPSARELSPEIPNALSGVIEQLHAKDPAKRIQSASDVARLLKSARGRENNETQPKLTVRQPAQQSRKTRQSVAAILIVVAMLAVGMVWLASRPDGASGKTDLAQSVSPGGQNNPPDDAPSQNLDKKQTQNGESQAAVVANNDAPNSHENPVTAVRPDANRPAEMASNDSEASAVKPPQFLAAKDNTPSAKQPFVLEDPDGHRAVFSSLKDAVGRAKSGSRIVIHSNEEFEEPEIECGTTDLEISAAKGCYPTFRIAIDSDESGVLFNSNGDLTLSGLTFRFEQSDHEDEDADPAVIVEQNAGRLTIQQCRVVGAGPCVCCQLRDAESCSVSDSEFYCPDGTLLEWMPDCGEMTLQNCVLVAAIPINVESGATKSSATISVTNCTTVSEQSLFHFEWEETPIPAHRLQVSNCILSGGEAFITVTNPEQRGRSLIERLFQYSGHDNVRLGDSPAIVLYPVDDDEEDDEIEIRYSKWSGWKSTTINNVTRIPEADGFDIEGIKDALHDEQNLSVQLFVPSNPQMKHAGIDPSRFRSRELRDE